MPSKAAKAARSAKRAAKHIVPTLGPGTAAGTSAANSTDEGLCDIRHGPSSFQPADITVIQPTHAPEHTRNMRRSTRRSARTQQKGRGQRHQMGAVNTRSERRSQPEPQNQTTRHSPTDARDHQQCSAPNESDIRIEMLEQMFLEAKVQDREPGMLFTNYLKDLRQYIHGVERDMRILISANSKAMLEVLHLLSMDNPPSDPMQRSLFEGQVYSAVTRILKSQRQRLNRRERRKEARVLSAASSAKPNQVQSQIHTKSKQKSVGLQEPPSS